MKPRLLDLFCGAGGCSRGYQETGFYVVGVDNRPQPHYIGDEFYQADALEFCATHGREFDVIHASPPCQAYSKARFVHNKPHPALIPETRIALIKTGKLYIIENVEGAPLRACIFLCGTMFGLKTRRHRWFESNVDLGFAPASCSCAGGASRGELLNYHNTHQRNLYLRRGTKSGADALRESLGVKWMNFNESQEAIPPAYTRYIGGCLMKALGITK